ncbi:hypothetical protein LTR29_010482 [Friedmanniomyces endolithicus]|nr:hypothetical protein LTR29_010482 [Friedmanniomyces endolithicus]
MGGSEEGSEVDRVDDMGDDVQDEGEDEGEDETEDEIEDGLEDASEDPATARSTSSSPAESRGRRLHRDGGTRKPQGAARLGAADSPVRTESSSLSRPRDAVEARREDQWYEQIHQFTAALQDAFVQPKSTITLAIERCITLLAVQQLPPDDQDDLFQALAQSTNADIFVELPKEDLVWYVEQLLLEVKQSPRAALNRCSKLAAFTELQPAERNLLYAAVMQPPRAKAIAALSDTDLAAFLKELLGSLQQAAAAKSGSVAGFPEDRAGMDPAPAPVPPYQQHPPHQQLPPSQQRPPHPAHQQYQQHPRQPPRPLHQQDPQHPSLQQPQQHPPHQPYTPHPNGVGICQSPVAATTTSTITSAGTWGIDESIFQYDANASSVPAVTALLQR